MDLKASEDTRLLYCTTGVLREKLIGKKNMHQYTHVILDEVRSLCPHFFACELEGGIACDLWWLIVEGGGYLFLSFIFDI